MQVSEGLARREPDPGSDGEQVDLVTALLRSFERARTARPARGDDKHEETDRG